MKKLLKHVLSLTLLTLVGQVAFAQDVQMADTMRSNGKIYVVVSIVLVILGGLIAYLFSIDRKVKKLQNDLAAKQKQTR